MEKILIANGNPEKVIDIDNVHYFYWKIELGVGKIKIGKYKIPLLPIKTLDYEPVKTLTCQDEPIALSRFHYRILTIFNNLKLHEGKPIIDFLIGSHSPIIRTEKDFELGSHIYVPQLIQSEEVDALSLYMSLFFHFFVTNKTDATDNLMSYDLSKEEIPEEAIFNPSSMIAYVFAGHRPTNKELETIGLR